MAQADGDWWGKGINSTCVATWLPTRQSRAQGISRRGNRAHPRAQSTMQLELLYLSVFLCISLNKHSETHIYYAYPDVGIVETVSMTFVLGTSDILTKEL